MLLNVTYCDTTFPEPPLRFTRPWIATGWTRAVFAVKMNSFQLITVPPFRLIMDAARFRYLLLEPSRGRIEQGTCVLRTELA